MTPQGMVVLESRDSVAMTYARLKSVVARRGLTIFAELDFQRDAASVGLAIPQARLLLFGNPLAGTPLIRESPTVAIDLPLKVLVWQAQDESTWVGYNATEYLGSRHRLPANLLNNIEAIRQIADAAAKAGDA